MSDDFKMTIIISFFLALLFFLGYMAVQQEGDWKAWASIHCKIIGKINGSTSFGTGVTSSGDMAFMPIYTSDKTVYQCDDGVTYTR